MQRGTFGKYKIVGCWCSHYGLLASLFTKDGRLYVNRSIGYAETPRRDVRSFVITVSPSRRFHFLFLPSSPTSNCADIQTSYASGVSEVGAV